MIVITGKDQSLRFAGSLLFIEREICNVYYGEETTTTLLYLEVTIMKKTVIAIMGIAIAVIGICAMHGLNDDYVVNMIEDMSGQILINDEDEAIAISDVHFDEDTNCWIVDCDMYDYYIETEFGVIAHNIGSKHIYHHTAEQLFNTYNELNSMDVFDI